MKFDDMTTSKDVTQKLIDLGVRLPSFFTRFYSPETEQSSVRPTCQSASAMRGDSNMPAYTVSELLEINLGWHIDSDVCGGWFVSAINVPMEHYPSTGTSLPDAICEQLIWAIENKAITVEEINNT